MSAQSEAPAAPRFRPGDPVIVTAHPDASYGNVGEVVTDNGASYGVRVKGSDGLGRIIEVPDDRVRRSPAPIAHTLLNSKVPANHATREAVA